MNIQSPRTATIGVDFGTLSARAVVIAVSDGTELGTATSAYRHGVLEDSLPASLMVSAEAKAVSLGLDWALQVPSDYVESMIDAVRGALREAETHGVEAADIVGIATDFTACTVLPTQHDGTPLCELAAFRARPHAYVKLWKHHAAQRHADRLNAVAHDRGERWIHRYGGKLSSEWELAKALQVLEEDPEVWAATERWVEAADWIVWQLCGVYLRNACASGFKAAYQDGSYPSRDYFAAVHPDFANFIDDKVSQPLGRLGDRAGGLLADIAERMGLPAGIAVAVGNVDAHVTAPAAGAVEAGSLVAIMGTSTCHVLNGAELRDVKGMCGVVDGGLVPGLWAYEAGQSGVGDIFGWFVDHGVAPEVHSAAAAEGLDVHQFLTRSAAEQAPGEHGLIALDWHSGNRSVLVDHELSGLIVGLTLATRPSDIYRALIEATAFGTRVIVERLEAAGVPVDRFIAAGGLIKNPLVMQVYADVLNRPISVVRSSNAPALGSAMHAAVACGAYADIRAAAAAMSSVDRDVWQPNQEAVAIYNRLFSLYLELHDQFGEAGSLMHRLRAIRNGASTSNKSVAERGTP